MPSPLTPHNTVNSLAYFSLGQQDPCCSTSEGQDLLAPWAARIGKSPGQSPEGSLGYPCDVEEHLFSNLYVLCSAQHSEPRMGDSTLVAFQGQTVQRGRSRSEGPSMFWIFTRIDQVSWPSPLVTLYNEDKNIKPLAQGHTCSKCQNIFRRLEIWLQNSYPYHMYTILTITGHNLFFFHLLNKWNSY